MNTRVVLASLSLLALVNSGPVEAALTPETVRQVLAQTDKDHYADAERMASHYPALFKLVLWKDYLSANPTGDFASVTRFIDENPDWPLMATMEKRAEAQISAATPAIQILAWFDHHKPVTADGGIALSKAYEVTGRPDLAAQTARDTWVNMNFGAIQEHQFLAQFSHYLTADDHWSRVDRLLWDKQAAAARGMLLRLDLPHRQLAQARIALQDDKGGGDAAVAGVPPQLRDDPGLVYDRVHWRRTQDMDEDAIDLLSHPARNLVRPDLWWQERGILARRALQKGWISRAYQVASDNGLPPDSNQAVDAEFLSGWIALRFLHDRETAQQHFQKVSQSATTSASKSRAAYWLGRAAEDAQDAKQAQDWYTLAAQWVTTYYGQLAITRLDQHHWPVLADPEPRPEDVHWLETNEVAQAVDLLSQGDDTDGMRPFLIRLNELAKTPGQRTLIGQLAVKYGRADLGLAVARRAERDGVTLASTGWPTVKVDTDSGVERALVLAVIRQESGFNADAASSAGAKGLMQLLPSTAQKVARSIRLAFTAKKLEEPAYNIRVGAAYLDSLINDFHGSYILALAAYNAGPSRARKWIKEMGDPRDPNVDVVDWIESIPFTETRNYVQRVMESVEVYRHRLGLPAGAGLEADLRRFARQE